MKVVSLSNALGIGERISECLNCEHVNAVHKIFPDGEVYVRIDSDLENEDVILVQSLYPNQNTRIVELLIAIDLVKEAGSKSVIAVIPYLAYSRQDREFLRGEAVSIRSLLKSMRSLGLDAIVTIDVHSSKVPKYFDGSFKNIIPAPLFAEYLLNKEEVDPGNTVVVAPDKGAEVRARELSKMLNTEYIVIKKFRDRYTGEITHEFSESVSVDNKVCVIVDDIISTGGTVASIASFLTNKGAKSVIVVASHGLFVKDALSKLSKAGVSKVVVLKTVPPIVSDLTTYLDPSELICGAIKELIR